MRFVPVKSVEQQSMLCVHKLREGLKEERTACINRIRGLLAEFGLVFAQSPEALRTALPDALEDASNELGTLARLTLQRAAAHWRELDEHIAWCTDRIAEHRRDNADVRRASELIGIGPITASAAVATVGDFKQFKSGSQFGAWVGLVPRQRSSGGKSNLGGITKHGQTYLRTLMIQAAKSAVMDRTPTQRPDLALGACPARAIRLAESGGGSGQQERSHPVGSDDTRRSLRCRSPQRQARLATGQPFLHDVKTKTH